MVSAAAGLAIGGLGGVIADVFFGGVVGLVGTWLAYFAIVPLIEAVNVKNRFVYLSLCAMVGGGITLAVFEMLGDLFWEMAPVVLIGSIIVVAAGRERWRIRYDA